MMWSLQNLAKFTLRATDDDLGKVKDWYFDAAQWRVRYLVADTGSWLAHRRILIAPAAFRAIRAGERRVELNLSRQQVEDSPTIEADLPVSLQREREYFQYFGWAWYGLPGNAQASFGPAAPVPAALPIQPEREPQGDPHLRSSREVTGYAVQAVDGKIGRLDDILVEDQGWTLPYLVVDTGHWWAGRRTLILPGWISAIRWAEAAVHVGVRGETIRQAPPFDPDRPLTPEYAAEIDAQYAGMSAAARRVGGADASEKGSA